MSRCASLGLLGALLLIGCNHEKDGPRQGPGEATDLPTGDTDATDAPTDCLASEDSDGDGIDDATECAYPRVCVGDPQRDPPPPCDDDDDCDAGETCQGLDPNRADTDGDGLDDGDEDLGGDGTFDPDLGETDPRLPDTDLDGVDDRTQGLQICQARRRPSLTSTVAVSDQLRLGPGWGASRDAPATSPVGIVFDDATAEVAGLAYEATGDAYTLRAGLDGVTGLRLVQGSRSYDRDGRTVVRSAYRIDGASAGEVRDALALALTGGAPAAGTASWRAATVYDVSFSVVSGPTAQEVVVVAVAPADAYDDANAVTRGRVEQLADGSALHGASGSTSTRCETLVVDDLPRADVMFTVDVSGSMNTRQAYWADHAESMFDALDAAAVHAQVGLFEATHFTPDLAGWGFQWVQSTDPQRVERFQFRVTDDAYLDNPADTLRPYGPQGVSDTSEQPLAAGVNLLSTFEQNRRNGIVDPNRVLRLDTPTFVLALTDERPNDDDRFFSNDVVRWGATADLRQAAASTYFRDHGVRVYGYVNPLAATPCPSGLDFPRCVPVDSGGGFVPVASAAAEAYAGFDRIVADLVGQVSPLALSTTAVGPSVRVMRNGVEVPRSHQDGFVYDAVAGTVVVRGDTHALAIGDVITVAYEAWD